LKVSGVFEEGGRVEAIDVEGCFACRLRGRSATGKKKEEREIK